MGTQFTWFDEITDVADTIPDETERMRFIVAVVDYGTKGIEPNFAYPLNGLFAGVRKDIDCSVRSRNENKGGRKKKDTQNQPEETQETGVSEDENGGFPTEETGVSETEKPPVSETANGGLCEEQNLIKDKVGKDKLIEDKVGKKSRAAFKPPSPTEVEEYANEKSLDIDAEYFCDFYQSKGWKVGKDPMKDWRAAVRNWARRDNPKPKGSEDYAIYDKPVRVLRG